MVVLTGNRRQRGGRVPRLLLLFIVTYLVILILPVVTGIAVQHRTESLLREEILSANRGILRQFKITMDGELENLSMKTAQISETPKVRSLLAKMRINHPLDQYEVYEVDNLLRTALYTSRLVRRTYLFFRTADYVVSDGFSSSRRPFFELESGAGAIGFEEWVALLSQEHEGTLVSISENDLYYMESLIGSTGRDRDATICYVLDKARVRDLAASSGWVSGSSLFVLDGEGRTIVSREEGVRRLPSETGSAAQISDTIVIREPSLNRRIEYVLVLPKATILEKVDYIRKYAFAVLFATVLLGLCCGFFFARLQYHPVEKLLQLVSRRGAEQGGARNGNAYDAIQTALAGAFDGEKRYRELSASQRKELQKNFLYRMLSSLEMDEGARAEGLRSQGIAFPYRSFAIFMAIVENETVECMEAVDLASSEPLDLGGESQCMEVRVLKPSHVFIILANFDETRWDVRSAAARVRSLFEEQLGSGVTLAASCEKESVHALPQAYYEAVQALEYRDLLGPGELIEYRRIHPARMLFTYSPEDEIRLINLVRTGDAARAVRIVEGMLDFSSDWDRMAPERRTLLKYNLVGTFARLVGGSEVTDTDLTGILTCESLDSLRSLAVRITQKLCVQYQPADLTRRHRELVEKIRRYIEENYGDPSLNIARLGVVFKLTPYYISRIFREAHGMSLLEYINRYRVEQAKPILEETGPSVGQIARNVGYERQAAFIRVFKNLEGVTPGAYRDSRKR